jgi:hypothetical protein
MLTRSLRLAERDGYKIRFQAISPNEDVFLVAVRTPANRRNRNVRKSASDSDQNTAIRR